MSESAPRARAAKRRRGIGLALLGSSFAIQMVPPVLHAWAKALGVSDEGAMAGMCAVYLLLVAVVLIKG